MRVLPPTEGRESEVARLESFARRYDASIALPFVGWRIGLDPIIGMIPVVGDWAGALVSGYIVRRGIKLGVRRRTIARMALNAGIDCVVGFVPLIGDLFDAWFKANQRNVALIRRDLERNLRKPTEPDSTRPALRLTKSRSIDTGVES